ncbi:protein lethal(2)denticleless [Cephus cinctus]|uniref:Protein lethal(2)denticleless n=1 Tax=Cephus cinctus TaxID=211228 RepID=A0AAJ7C5H1_CEPCN|nr:protein lethal(2)denticleless [Cephus cinctus]
MNVVRAINRRQEGFESIKDYDIVLYRLKCFRNDVYHGILPTTNAPDFNPEPPVLACRFCTTPGYEHILALANEDGKVALQDTTINREPNQVLEGTQAHCNAIFDVAWMPGELKLVTTSGDHTARLWDVSRQEISQIDCFHAHTRSVKTAVFRQQDKAVFATGARDGAIMIWDIRANHNDLPKPDNCIFNAHGMRQTGSTKYHRRALSAASRAQSITGLVFQDDFTLLSCTAGDGLIKVWDLRKNYTVHKRDPLAKHVMNYAGGSTRNGFTSLLVCPAGITLYASCMDNIIYAYNITSYNPKPVAEFYGHKNSTFYVKTCLSPDGRYLASGSSDELAYIWHTNRPGGPLVKLSGHTEEVTCIAWCSVGETKIVTCSDDSCHRIWRVGPEYKIDNAEVQIQGEAEAVFNTNKVGHPGLETTPTVSRRWIINQERTPGSDSNPGINTPIHPNSDDISDTNCTSWTRDSTNSSKRNYSQISSRECITDSKFKSILSPIHENIEPLAKRAHLENRGARRLFSPGSDSETILNRGYDSDEPGPSSSIPTRKINSHLFSPTLNLPNFVIDGTAPHLLQMSPQKCKENMDWLTKIRKERYEQKIVKVTNDKASSPKAQLTPARRTGRSKSTEPRKVPKSPSISLLNFFKITGKECDKELCSEKPCVISTQTESEQQR